MPSAKSTEFFVTNNRTNELLTVEQEAYARARAMGMTIKEAASSIGKSYVYMSKVERNEPKVRQRIIQLTKLATDNAILRTGLNREWVISRLMQVVDRCMQAEEVKDKEGQPTGEFKFDASGANQALKMLGDTMGMFKPQEKPDDEYANLTDADLARIAHELAAQTGLLTYSSGDEAAPGPQ